MAPDGLGPDAIEVDDDMSRPSDPTPCKRICSWVLAPIAFSVRKSFLEKFLGNGVRSVRSVRSVVFIDKFSAHFRTLCTLRVRSRDLLHCEKQKPTEKPIGGLPL